MKSLKASAIMYEKQYILLEYFKWSIYGYYSKFPQVHLISWPFGGPKPLFNVVDSKTQHNIL
jgi:hypothetical protein